MSKELESKRACSNVRGKRTENKVRLDEIPVGGKFDTESGKIFIALEQEGDVKTAVTTEGLYRKDVRFDDDSNEYFTSELSDLFEEEIFLNLKRNSVQIIYVADR